MESARELNHRHLYRLPWSLTDNVISWLEPTKQCNIHCEGCYSTNAPGSHKTLLEVMRDLDTFSAVRQTDAVSIAGGDPLTHPAIVEIVREVARRGYKPIVNTNGVAATPELLQSLRDAGLKGVTFHVDSRQKRPGWTGSSEKELNALRQMLAEEVAAVGGVTCAFNATVYEDTLAEVPDIVEWGRDHAHIAQVMVFIAFRAAIRDGRYDYYVGEQRLDMAQLSYGAAKAQRIDISSREILDVIRGRFPEIEPCAYLNGTEDPTALKWLMSLAVTDDWRYLGSVGRAFIELAQSANHLRHNRYLGYVSPAAHRRARWMLLLAGLDRGLRRILKRDLGLILRDPLRLFRPLHLQSIMIIQPVDTRVDGRQSMCDGCPDLTVHDGELVWSCRLEEHLRLGGPMRCVPAREHPADRTPVRVAEPVGGTRVGAVVT